MTIGQQPQRFVEGDALDLHDEFEYVAAGAAAEAFVELVPGVDRKRGSLFVMERTQSFEALSQLPQAHHFANDFDNVHLRFQLLNEIHRRGYF